MTEKLVPTVRTTPTTHDFAAALLEEWPEATKEGAGVLFAQFAGETGSGLYCWNFDLGNVKYSKGCGCDYVALAGVWEGFLVRDEDGDGDVDADDRVMLEQRMLATGLWVHDPNAGHAVSVGASKLSLVATKANTGTWFRAYPDLASGMRAFVGMKRDPKSRYASAWAFVEAGDPDGYAREIGRLGYYSASPDAYSRSMQALYAKWMADSAFDDAKSERPTEPSIPAADPAEPEMPIVHPELDWTRD